jgi:hypothetical protein
MQFDKLNVSVKVLDQSSATFHPVTTIEISDLSHGLDLGAMDMSANHTLNVVFVSHVDHGFLVFRDVFNRRFGLVFQITRQ